MNSSEPYANAISKEGIIWAHHGSDFYPRFNTDRTLRCFARYQQAFSSLTRTGKPPVAKAAFAAGWHRRGSAL